MDTKIVLKENEMPREWYNILADLPTPLPPVLHPGTKEPVTPDDLKPIFPMGLIEQEVSSERWIKIPEEVLEVLSLWRPTALYRAKRLEKAINSPAKIYYKYEGWSPPGSHKPNTAVAQAYYNKKEGIKRLATETGAGQWGSALCFATQFFGLECTVYMVRVSYEQKPYRRVIMETWGGKCIPSPSKETQSGKKILEADPDSPGSLGIAISEAVEDAATHPDTNYSLGSVLNHVCLHQTVVGLEAKKQFEVAGDYPDIVIGCVGGGSNFSGFAFPFLQDKFNGKDVRVIAVEPTSCPTLTKGLYAYDFGDVAGLTPLIKMHTLGHTFVPPKIHAGGLRYHGDAPILCHLVKNGFIEAQAYPQRSVFEAALVFARSEGIVMAPETAHAFRSVLDEVERCKQEGKEKVIAFNLSGHGNFDLGAYDEYLNGNLQDYALPEDELKRALSELPKV